MPARPHERHQFAVFDGATVADGSFNRTRTASSNSYENLVVSTDPELARVLGGHFEQLRGRLET